MLPDERYRTQKDGRSCPGRGRRGHSRQRKWHVMYEDEETGMCWLDPRAPPGLLFLECRFGIRNCGGHLLCIWPEPHSHLLWETVALPPGFYSPGTGMGPRFANPSQELVGKGEAGESYSTWEPEFFSQNDSKFQVLYWLYELVKVPHQGSISSSQSFMLRIKWDKHATCLE